MQNERLAISSEFKSKGHDLHQLGDLASNNRDLAYTSETIALMFGKKERP